MPPPLPARDVVQRFGVTVDSYLGGRANQHWRVTSPAGPAVLRRYQARPQGEIGYELRVLAELGRLGWPTPVALADPIEAHGRTWCLFAWLRGGATEPRNTAESLRRRGHLLAQLHADTETLAWLGQRPGCARAEDLLADPVLTKRLRAYERRYPRSGRILRWHADKALEYFSELDLTDDLIVLHGDFADQNLLYQGTELTGILDFEATHLNHRASEFALSWRGKYDELVHAYNEVRPLDELDWALLTPTLWSWVFIGVVDELDRMLSEQEAPHGFDWQIGMLLRRSPLMGRAQEPYAE
jgi:aminoglycoside phosphotransferase (APT) family kinase protein